MLDAGDAECPFDFFFSGTGCTKSLCIEYYRNISIISRITRGSIVPGDQSYPWIKRGGPNDEDQTTGINRTSRDNEIEEP
ncbi:hypothetical protein DdX_19911 [Ditylenchus destructor]|uniref:Uncharacterized protein n=1 Tax=Ditylenchus destructor TaxID=166010 RepID=A0AAD4QWV8_9BILA|nr:hypothetical protein DdX_19911 [Ditylenchus destructor]